MNVDFGEGMEMQSQFTSELQEHGWVEAIDRSCKRGEMLGLAKIHSMEYSLYVFSNGGFVGMKLDGKKLTGLVSIPNVEGVKSWLYDNNKKKLWKQTFKKNASGKWIYGVGKVCDAKELHKEFKKKLRPHILH